MKKQKRFFLLLFFIVVLCAGVIKIIPILHETWMKYRIRNEYIVVSLTTTPHRIAKIASTLQTIVDQNAPIRHIYLCLPDKFSRDNLRYAIPAWLQKNKQITILRSKDYGPATKLLGVLEKTVLPDNAIIVTVDDDVLYQKNLVLYLAYNAMQNPKYAIGVSGADPDYAENGVLGHDLETGLIKRYDKADFVTVLQGYAGVAYRPVFFGNDIFDIINYPQACIKSDDIYLSFYLARYNVMRKTIKTNSVNAYNIKWHTETSIAPDALHRIDKVADKYRACLLYLQSKYPDVAFGS